MLTLLPLLRKLEVDGFSILCAAVNSDFILILINFEFILCNSNSDFILYYKLLLCFIQL